MPHVSFIVAPVQCSCSRYVRRLHCIADCTQGVALASSYRLLLELRNVSRHLYLLSIMTPGDLV